MKLMSLLLWSSIVALPAWAGTAPDAGADALRKQVEEWRAARVERLRKPDGWLSLVGLHWIEPGTHSVGSAADSDIVLNVGPARLGTVSADGKRIHLALADGVEATIGDGVAREADLASDASGSPTLVRFGSANLQVIERSGRFAFRVKDAQARTRLDFVGIDYFDIDPAWRIDARFEPHPAGSTIEIANVLGMMEPMANPGAVVFEHAGKTYRFEAVDEGDGQLFLMFGDRSNGRETYGAGRFLYAAPPVAGSDRVSVDFNRAYNPPCVFTPYATCPLPPPGNRVDFAITAGEKKYRGATH